LPPSTEWSKKYTLCGRNGYIIKKQSLLHEWHGELAGEADWLELICQKKEELNLMNGRFGRKERNEQQGSK
jgi:hypothetical protein